MIEVPANEEWTFATGRLFLGPMFVSDTEELFALLKEPRLHTFTGGTPPKSTHDLRERISRRETRRSAEGDELWLNWTLRLRMTGTVLVTSSRPSGTIELSWHG